jgi:hypothetical protein
MSSQSRCPTAAHRRCREHPVGMTSVARPSFRNPGWGRISVSASAKALRAFFRYAAVRGWCRASIATGIDGPRMLHHEGLPVGPPWPDVQRWIASTSGDPHATLATRHPDAFGGLWFPKRRGGGFMPGRPELGNVKSFRSRAPSNGAPRSTRW